MTNNEKLIAYRLSKVGEPSLDGDNGFQLVIYRNGSLKYSRFHIDCEQPSESIYYRIPLDGIQPLEKCITKSKFSKLPHNLDNESDGGYYMELTYYCSEYTHCVRGKNILNKYQGSLSLLFQKENHYLGKKENYKAEYIFSKVFHRICRILEDFEYDLSLYEFTTHKRALL